MTTHIIIDDCREAMAAMEPNSVDAIVTDPPAGIAFMGKAWDSDKGGRDAWVAWLAGVMAEALRVAKPGAHAVVWALPRTSGWTHRALEDAGWEVRDVVTHLTGQGFPKSLDVSKALDKAAGAEREVVGERVRLGDRAPYVSNDIRGGRYASAPGNRGPEDITAPATDLARQWEGWGTALKPGHEMWVLARKPLMGGSGVARNVAEHGTGALNIDGCRIGAPDDKRTAGTKRYTPGNMAGGYGVGQFQDAPHDGLGRWPANVILSHAPGCVEVGTRRVKGAGWRDTDKRTTMLRGNVAPDAANGTHYADADDMETVTAWECAPGCAVAALDAQSGERTSGGTMRGQLNSGRHGGLVDLGRNIKPGTDGERGYTDAGGASCFFLNVAPIDAEDWDGARFMYQAKASRSERNAGLDGMPEQRKKVAVIQTPGVANDGDWEEGKQLSSAMANHHPTVKPVALMRWLVRLVAPSGGLILDPFAGSGSTGVACVAEDFRFVGIEMDPEYAAIAEARIAHAEAVHDTSAPLFAEVMP